MDTENEQRKFAKESKVWGVDEHTSILKSLRRHSGTVIGSHCIAIHIKHDWHSNLVNTWVKDNVFFTFYYFQIFYVLGSKLG